MTDHHSPTPILDVRPAKDFRAAHPRGAVNIPLETLAERISELPPPTVPLQVFDVSPARRKAALETLARSNRTNVNEIVDAAWQLTEMIETGPSQNYLWRPHGLVARGLTEMRLVWGDRLREKRAVDLACGVGRDAAALALGGLSVEGWDVLPEALQRADCLAAACGVKLTTRLVDIEAGGTVLTPKSFDVVVCFHYLHRPLMLQIEQALRPGGFVVYETFTVAQREKIGKPRKDKHLLRPGELASYFSGWQICWNAEGESDERWVASLIARKPNASKSSGQVASEDRTDAER